MRADKFGKQGLTFDDVLLIPAHSDVLPRDVDVRTHLTQNVTLNIPVMSAGMDTVTEARLAIAMAQIGGIGILHKNLTVEQQAAEVAKVKKFESGVIRDPITVGPETTIRDVLALTQAHNISGVPVVDADGQLAGIVTHRDMRFETELDDPVRHIMTKKDRLITVRGARTQALRRLGMAADELAGAGARIARHRAGNAGIVVTLDRRDRGCGTAPGHRVHRPGRHRQHRHRARLRGGTARARCTRRQTGLTLELTRDRRGQAAGLTLAQIRQVLDIRDHGQAPCDHVRDLLDARLTDIDLKLRQLHDLRDTLAGLRDQAEHVEPDTCSSDQVCRYL